MGVRISGGYKSRAGLRREIKIPVLVCHEDGRHIVAAYTIDLSVSGAKLKIANDVILPVQFRIALSMDGHVQRLCRLVWRNASQMGVRFIQPKH